METDVVIVGMVVEFVSRDVDVIFMFIAGGDLSFVLHGFGGVGGQGGGAGLLLGWSGWEVEVKD